MYEPPFRPNDYVEFMEPQEGRNQSGYWIVTEAYQPWPETAPNRWSINLHNKSGWGNHASPEQLRLLYRPEAK